MVLVARAGADPTVGEVDAAAFRSSVVAGRGLADTRCTGGSSRSRPLAAPGGAHESTRARDVGTKRRAFPRIEGTHARFVVALEGAKPRAGSCRRHRGLDDGRVAEPERVPELVGQNGTKVHRARTSIERVHVVHSVDVHVGVRERSFSIHDHHGLGERTRHERARPVARMEDDVRDAISRSRCDGCGSTYGETHGSTGNFTPYTRRDAKLCERVLLGEWTER